MVIRLKCSCGQAIEASADMAGSVIACPRCVKSVYVPKPDASLAPPKGKALPPPPPPPPGRRGGAVVCRYCAWRNNAEGRTCPSCGRAYGTFSLVGCLTNLFILAVLAGCGYGGYRYLELAECRGKLEKIGAELYVNQQDAYEKRGSLELATIQQEQGWPVGPVRSWKVDAPVLDIPIFTRPITGKVSIRVKIVEHSGKMLDDVRYSVTVTQRYAWDGVRKDWRAEGDPEVWKE